MWLWFTPVISPTPGVGGKQVAGVVSGHGPSLLSKRRGPFNSRDSSVLTRLNRVLARVSTSIPQGLAVYITKFDTVAHGTEGLLKSVDEFESIFKTALDRNQGTNRVLLAKPH